MADAIDDPQVDDVETSEEAVDQTTEQVVDNAPEDAAPAPPEQAELPLDDPAMEAESSASEQAQEEAAWKQILGQAGFNDFESIDHAAERFVESHKLQESRINELADRVRSYEALIAAQGGAQRSPQQQPESASAADPPKPKSALGELVDGWKPIPTQLINQYWTEDNKISPEAPPEVRDQLIQAQQQVQNWQELMNDPPRFLAALTEHLAPTIQQQFETEYSQRQQTQSEESALVDFESQNADWLYEKDPATGNVLVDPLNRNPIWSAKGQQFRSILDHVDNTYGVQTNAARLEIAMALHNQQQANIEQAPVQRRQAASQVNEQKKREMRGRRNTAPNTQTAINGVSPNSGAEEPGAAQQSIGEYFAEQLKSA